MKATLKSILIMALVLAFSTNIDAQKRFNNPDQQRGQRYNCAMQWNGSQTFRGNQNQRLITRLNLSDEQQTQVQQHRLAGQKEMLPLRNQLREKNAQLRTLTTAENFNQTAVNQLVEEIGDLRTQMLAKRVEHRQEMRSLLTEEQRIMFDSSTNRGGLGKNTQRGFRR